MQMCCWAWNRFMGRGKLFLQPSSTGIAATGDFLFLPPFSFIHSFFLEHSICKLMKILLHVCISLRRVVAFKSYCMVQTFSVAVSLVV